MRFRDSVFFFLSILLIFFEGIWLAQILARINAVLNVYFYHSSYAWISNIFSFFSLKIPVIAENLAQFILAFAHLFVSLIALKLYFKWSKKQFFYGFIGAYIAFIFTSVTLILLYAIQVRFFSVWQDFINLFFSPFLIIFIFLVIKLVKK
ncbi:MAG: hypothetical protein EAZ08_11495 [Cytophagales bacterium]|nr:MAG: hypothetical protein EAZ08_11495 [Cytophagales bacterium]